MLQQIGQWFRGSSDDRAAWKDQEYELAGSMYVGGGVFYEVSIRTVTKLKLQIDSFIYPLHLPRSESFLFDFYCLNEINKTLPRPTVRRSPTIVPSSQPLPNLPTHIPSTTAIMYAKAGLLTLLAAAVAQAQSTTSATDGSSTTISAWGVDASDIAASVISADACKTTLEIGCTNTDSGVCATIGSISVRFDLRLDTLPAQDSTLTASAVHLCPGS